MRYGGCVFEWTSDNRAVNGDVLTAKMLHGDDFQTVMKKRLETAKAVTALRTIVMGHEEIGLDTVIE